MDARKAFAVFAVLFLALPLLAVAQEPIATTDWVREPGIAPQPTAQPGDGTPTLTPSERAQRAQERIEEAKARIDAAKQRLEQARERVKTLVGNLIQRAKGLFNRLDRIVEILQSKGVDTTELEAQIAEYKAKVTDAEGKYGTNVREAARLLRGAMMELRDVRAELREALKELREQNREGNETVTATPTAEPTAEVTPTPEATATPTEEPTATPTPVVNETNSS